MEFAENRSPRRVGWLHRLVVLHLLLAVAPVALYFIPGHVYWLPAMWLGLAMGFAGRSEKFAWWLPPCFALATVMPTVIVVGSLLVARRHGYRLVPKH